MQPRGRVSLPPAVQLVRQPVEAFFGQLAAQKAPLGQQVGLLPRPARQRQLFVRQALDSIIVHHPAVGVLPVQIVLHARRLHFGRAPDRHGSQRQHDHAYAAKERFPRALFLPAKAEIPGRQRHQRQRAEKGHRQHTDQPQPAAQGRQPQCQQDSPENLPVGIALPVDGAKLQNRRRPQHRRRNGEGHMTDVGHAEQRQINSSRRRPQPRGAAPMGKALHQRLDADRTSQPEQRKLHPAEPRHFGRGQSQPPKGRGQKRMQKRMRFRNFPCAKAHILPQNGGIVIHGIFQITKKKDRGHQRRAHAQPCQPRNPRRLFLHAVSSFPNRFQQPLDYTKKALSAQAADGCGGSCPQAVTNVTIPRKNRSFPQAALTFVFRQCYNGCTMRLSAWRFRISIHYHTLRRVPL